MPLDSNRYNAEVAELLAAAPLNVLGPGEPLTARRAALARLTPESIAAPHKLVDRPMAAACLAGLWLRFDFLDESHKISQDIETTSGSFWHGIMHRREPDYGNARYWFRRVGRHPVFEPLCAAARELAGKSGSQASCLAELRSWDPFEFVELCEQAERGNEALASLCREIQRREWELLFEFCHAQATGQ
jgi:hypothetical protein